jgi:hypothetical protein
MARPYSEVEAKARRNPMANFRLNQAIALEKGAKARSHEASTKAYQTFQKPQLFTGFTKRYSPLDENGIKKPDEGNKVQYSAEDMLADAAKGMTELFDVSLTKDMGNQLAVADVVVNGQKLLERVPVTTLLFLEKKLVDIHTMVKAIPTLDTGENWTGSRNADGLYETHSTETQSFENYDEPVVIVPPTHEHPAQVVNVKKQRVLGTWRTVKFSGAVPATRVRQLLERVEALQKAVKLAREQCNMTEVSMQDLGSKVFSFLLASG